MDPDQEICLCFHVTLRKLQQHLRVVQPRRASQLSDCGGAGTGCGWCRPTLARLHQAACQHEDVGMLPDATQYQADRADYLNRQTDRQHRQHGRRE